MLQYQEVELAYFGPNLWGFVASFARSSSGAARWVGFFSILAGSKLGFTGYSVALASMRLEVGGFARGGRRCPMMGVQMQRCSKTGGSGKFSKLEATRRFRSMVSVLFGCLAAE